MAARLGKQKKTDPAVTGIPIFLYSPLVEAVFEVHWTLQKDPQTGNLYDPAYPMIYGSLYEHVKEEFPCTEDLPAARAQAVAAPYVVRHRIRKEQNGYPLLQIGPGIGAVNEAAGYSWDSFRGSIHRFMELLLKLYPENTALHFIRSEVRFLNAIPVDMSKEHLLAFLAEKLHIKLDMDSSFLSNNDLENEYPLAANINVVYPLRKMAANLGVSVQLGKASDGRPIYLVQFLVQSLGEDVPVECSGFDHWIAQAHEAVLNSFSSLCRGHLFEQFCGRS